MERAESAPFSRSCLPPLGTGLLLRLALLWLVAYSFEVGDASAYRRSALTLLDQGVYSLEGAAPWTPTALRPPLYPTFEALVALVSRSTLALQLVQIALSLFSVWLLWRVARRLMPSAAQTVLWMAALNPFDGVYAGAGLSECLVTALLVGTIGALVLLEGWQRLVVAGLLAGGLCLVRDIFVPLVPLAAGAWWLAGGRAQLAARLRPALTVCVLAGLVVIPWTLRNAAQFGKFIPVSAGRLGYSLWLGGWALNADFTASDATGRVYPDEAYRSEQERAQVAEAERNLTTGDGVFRKLFGERLRAEPMQVIGRWLRRWPRLWLGTRYDIFELNPTVFPRGSPQWTAVKAGLYGLNALFVVGAFVGAWFAWRRRLALTWAVLPLAFTSLIHLPLNSFENRYSQPMFPLLTLLAAFAARELWERRMRARVAS